jgi:hypothetical protein
VFSAFALEDVRATLWKGLAITPLDRGAHDHLFCFA